MSLQTAPSRQLRATRAYHRTRVGLADGATTTMHVVEFERDVTVPRVVAIPGPTTLARWSAEHGVADAVVGGFFLRPQNIPLGELWVGGERRASVPFDAPWDRFRAAVAIADGDLRIARRPALRAEPVGDLLQAGPLLVEAGEPLIGPGDPEGFSAGSRQFDSDITAGRYPRAALGAMASRLVVAVCEGRAAEEAGLTLAELAEAVASLGAETAINLDGGGSASLVVGGRLVNRPREEHGIEILGGRPIATAIAFDPL